MCGLLMRATGDEWHAEDIKLEVATDSDVDLDWGVAVPPPPLPQRRPHPEHSGGGISPVAMREQQQQQQPASIRPIHWEHVLRLLQAGVVQQRPSRIADADCVQEQVFLERPALKRRKGDDKWLTSGGRKGASERWGASGTVGVLKRYGRVVRAGMAGLKFAQYTLQTRSSVKGKPSQDKNRAVVWVVQALESAAAMESAATDSAPYYRGPGLPGPGGGAAAAAAVHTDPRTFTASPGAGPDQAAVDVRATNKFIAFASTVPGEDGMELGAVVRGGSGIKLQSSQGDFAEWYKRAAGEAPMEEGDVIGFRKGRITRKTSGCAMLGCEKRVFLDPVYKTL